MAILSSTAGHPPRYVIYMHNVANPSLLYTQSLYTKSVPPI